MCVVSLPLPGQAQQDKLGKVTFPTSWDPRVQVQFERGVAMLHSYWFLQQDSSCAMAYWGIAVDLLGNTLVGPPPLKATARRVAGHHRAVHPALPDADSRLASSHRIPTMFEDRYYVDGGGLMSYGPNVLEGYRRAAHYVDKILKGAKPADLPVEQPTRFELTVNMKTAKALGITTPRSIVGCAEQVVE